MPFAWSRSCYKHTGVGKDGVGKQLAARGGSPRAGQEERRLRRRETRRADAAEPIELLDCQSRQFGAIRLTERPAGGSGFAPTPCEPATLPRWTGTSGHRERVS